MRHRIRRTSEDGIIIDERHERERKLAIHEATEPHSAGMGSVRGCLPPLEGNRRRRTLDEYDMGVAPHAGGGDALSDLHAKLAHIQWRKHANDKSIRYEQGCWLSPVAWDTNGDCR